MKCVLGHDLTDRARSLDGLAYCLVCVALMHEKAGTVEAHLIQVLMGAAPLPSPWLVQS